MNGFLALSSMDFIGVCRWGRFYSHGYPDVYIMVGFCPVIFIFTKVRIPTPWIFALAGFSAVYSRVQSGHLEGRCASAHSLSWGSLLWSGGVSLKLSRFSDGFGGLREFHRHINTVYSICSILVLKHKRLIWLDMFHSSQQHNIFLFDRVITREHLVSLIRGNAVHFIVVITNYFISWHILSMSSHCMES